MGTASLHHSKFRNVSELLFHPSNFDAHAVEDNHVNVEEMQDMDASEFERMIFDIQNIYKKINSKLQLWLGFVSKGDRASKAENKHKVMKELSGLQCDVS